MSKRLTNEEGLTYEAIADRCDICVSTVGKVVKMMNNTPQKSQINEEFENAVNQMIAEAKEPEPAAMNTAKIPEAVLDAVTAQISRLENIVACNLDEIRTLQRENEEYRTKIANIRTWLAEVDA